MEFYFWFFVVLNFIENHVFSLALLLISLTSLMFVFRLLYRIRQLKWENLKLRESIKTLLEAEINFDDCEGEGESQVTFDGNTSGMIPAGSTERPGILISDTLDGCCFENCKVEPDITV